VSLNDQLDGPKDDEATGSEGEEEDVDLLLDAAPGPSPKARNEVRGWEELCEQIKEDLLEAYKGNKTCTQVNQLTILRNFMMLHIKGLGCIDISNELVRQWHEGIGIHFAHHIHFLAHHYQLFEQLPIKKRGNDRGQSLLSNKWIQMAVRAYLSNLAVGEVTPKRFYHALNTQILPTLGYPPTKSLLEWMARQWLIKLGWRHIMLKKGIYMDGHERPDIL
jgi:hypothetical protein